MPRRVVRVLNADGDTLRVGIGAIQKDLGVVPEFPDEVERAARQAAGQPRLPGGLPGGALDLLGELRDHPELVLDRRDPVPERVSVGVQDLHDSSRHSSSPLASVGSGQHRVRRC